MGFHKKDRIQETEEVFAITLSYLNSKINCTFNSFNTFLSTHLIEIHNTEHLIISRTAIYAFF